MKKIHWMSDSPFTPTGYSTMTRNILNGLSSKYGCSMTAVNYTGNDLPKGCVKLKDGTPLNFDLYGNGSKPKGEDIIEHRVRTLRPDYFGILADTFHVYPWILNMNFSPAKSFFYFPSDGGGGLPHDCEKVLRHMNVAVAMSKYGQHQVKRLYDLDVEYIPHAVHEKIYFPVKSKADIRKDFIVRTALGTDIQGWLKDKFVVGMVARNQSRKMIDFGVKAFKLFCKDKPDAILYLHMDPDDAVAAFNLKLLINRVGLLNRVVFSPIKYFSNFEYKDMNKVYNVMDVFFLSTSGEGFGVPIIEAMAAEIPVVVTDYTTTPELVLDDGQCGLAVPIYNELTGSWNVERGLINIEKAAQALTNLYDNKKTRERFGKTGRKKVLKQYTWKEVIRQWESFLESI